MSDIVYPTYYLRPLISLALDNSGLDGSRSWAAEKLCGRDDITFADLELIGSNRPRSQRGTLLTATGAHGFDGQDWYHPPFDGHRMWDIFDALRAPRAPLRGLKLDRPRIMGIVNVTPDSFSDGGSHASTQAAIDHALRLVEEGADILDIGGESTRPGSDAVPLDEELRRVIPVLEGLAVKTSAKLSVDTRKAEVMRRAAEAGADILNDVSALTHDPAALEAAADAAVPVVLMHAQGDPKTMQRDPHYVDAALDVYDFLEARIATCVAAGIPKIRIIADPGIGFGKTMAHNLEIMASLSLYHGLGVPLMLGASRKRFIGVLTGREVAAERAIGSVAAALAGVAQGVQIVRVHDVAETREALTVWTASISGQSLLD